MDDIDWGMIASGLPTPGTNPFDTRWPRIPPSVAPSAMQSPISPEMMAAEAAKRGVPPPPVDLPPVANPGDPLRLPDNGVGSSTWRNDFDLANNGDVGAALAGKAPVVASSDPQPGAPLDITPPGAAAKPEEKKTPTFADALKGVKMPASPEIQRLGTPAAPKATAVKGGELLALLSALNTQGQQAQSGYQLPSTLGQALLGRK